MAESHRALLMLLLVGMVVHRLADGLRGEQLPRADFLRRGLWFALTIVAFATGDFWMFVAVALPLLVWARRREENGPALFLALLFVVPATQQDVPGLGLVNFFFSLDLPRLLSLVLLLPLFLRLMRGREATAGTLPRLADLLFLAWLLLQLVLLAREPSLSSALRSVFYLFVDLVLPYFVFSRSLATLAKLRDAVAALVVAGSLLAAVAVFETSRGWLLYAPLTQDWSSAEPVNYLARGGLLRAMASTGHAIALGCVLAACLLLALPLRARLRAGWQRAAVPVLLAAGLAATLSRGPWLGAVAGLLLFLALGERPVRNVLSLAIAGLCALLLLSLLPAGRFVLDLLPFVGTVDAGNIEYRQLLLRNAAQLVAWHPLFGASDYGERLAAMGMVQGQGIVDVVNSYVDVALRTGLVGLGLFAGVLLTAWFAAIRARRQALRAGLREAADLGRALAAAQLAVIVIIGTVSSIGVIPWLYWCLAGTLVGYARTVAARSREARSSAGAIGFA